MVGEDIWTISQSIVNRTSVPRVLFKHEKRSREYINSVSRSSAATHSQPQTQYDPSPDYDRLTTLQPCPTVVRQSSQGHGSPQPHIVSLYLQAMMCSLISLIEK